MKIAIFSDTFYPETNTIAESILELAKQLTARKHIVRLYVPEYRKWSFPFIKPSGQTELVLDNNISLKEIPSLPYPLRNQIPTGSVSGSQVIDLRVFRPDVIHTHTPYGIGVEAIISSYILRIPLVGTNHTSVVESIKYSFVKGKIVESISGRFYTWYYNRCKHVTAPSQEILDFMKKHGLQRPSSVIPENAAVETWEHLYSTL